MAVKFTKTDDLDKMFEEFAALPKLEKVEFPDDKKKKETQGKAKKA
ncbi:SPJ_0845 family protein [Streptococcus sp. Marseille-P7376]|nr:SPJ_0845 family protein [Streptococcus sp. Marseille-P7376]